jgi:TRAP-type C4-dicarboxylate transport system substrate-binding protein
MPFRVLTDAEFERLDARDRAAYLKRATEAMDWLRKQLRHTLRDDQKNVDKAA